MSGGSYDYAYHRVEEFAGSMVGRPMTPLRRAFVKLLQDVAEAMHDIEWVDSGDCSPGDEDEAIKKALGAHWQTRTLAVEIKEAKRVRDEIAQLIAQGVAQMDAPAKAGDDGGRA